MKILHVLLGALLFAPVASAQTAKEAKMPYVQIAELEIDPAQLENYRMAAAAHAETAIRVEPGVLALYAVAAADPTHVTAFEIYRDAEANNISHPNVSKNTNRQPGDGEIAQT